MIFAPIIPFERAPGNVGEKIIMIHCVVSIFLLGMSFTMLFRRRSTATIGFVVAAAGIASARYLILDLALAR